MMNRYFLISFVAAVVAIASCGRPDDKEPRYKNQPVDTESVDGEPRTSERLASDEIDLGGPGSSTSGNGGSTDDPETPCSFNYHNIYSNPRIDLEGKYTLFTGAPAIHFKVTASATMVAKGNEDSTTFKINANVIKSNLGTTITRPFIDKLNGPLELAHILGADIDALKNKEPEWQSTRCLLRPVSSVQFRGANVAFEPALPMVITPLGSADQYDSEIGDSKKFKNVTATVTESTGDIQEGKKLKIDVQIEKISSTNSEYVYRVTLARPDQMQDVAALGFPLMGIEFHIDLESHTYRQVVVDAIIVPQDEQSQWIEMKK